MCDEIASVAAFFDAALISAGGCYGSLDELYSNRYSTFVRVVPDDRQVGNVYLSVVRKFQ